MQLCAGARPEPSTKGGTAGGWDPSSPEEAPCTPAGARVAPRGPQLPPPRISAHHCTSARSPHVCISPAAPVGPKRGPGHSPPRGWHSPTSLSFRQAPAPPPRACHMGGAWWTLTKAGQTPSGGQRLFGCWPWRGGGGDRGSQPTSQTTGAQDGAWCPEPQGRPQVPSVAFEAPPRPQPCFKHQQVLSKAGATLQP